MVVGTECVGALGGMYPLNGYGDAVFTGAPRRP